MAGREREPFKTIQAEDVEVGHGGSDDLPGVRGRGNRTGNASKGVDANRGGVLCSVGEVPVTVGAEKEPFWKGASEAEVGMLRPHVFGS